MEGFPYEEMLAARQTYYLGLYAEAAHALGEQLIGLRRYEEAEQLLLQVMERDPFDEAACILMIKSCEARGQRARGLSIRRKFTRLYQKDGGGGFPEYETVRVLRRSGEDMQLKPVREALKHLLSAGAVALQDFPFRSISES